MEMVTGGHFVATLEERLGSAVLSAYRFPACGNGYFTTDAAEEVVLLILDDDTSIHEFRETFREVWDTAEGISPLVTTRRALSRHLRLNPLFAHHLVRSAHHMSGELVLSGSRQASRPHALEQLAFLSRELLEGSSALAPGLLAEEEVAQARRRLVRLAHCLGDPSAASGAEIPDLFARIQVHLRHLIDRLPIGDGAQETVFTNNGDVPLKALYEDEDRLLAIIPSLSSRVLRQIDWPAFGQQLPGHPGRLAVATSEQLYLVVQAERALDYVLSTFRHSQGRNLLQGLNVRARAVFRQAARKPSHLLVGAVPRAYLLAEGEKELHRVLHDYQNRLQNISLEHELLHRAFGVPLSAPEDPLPGQDEAVEVRIEGLMAHLEWWAETYVQEMDRHPSTERMSPV